MTLFDPTLTIADVEENLNKLFAGKKYSLSLATKEVDAVNIGALSFVKKSSANTAKKIRGYEALDISKEALADVVIAIQKHYPHKYTATEVWVSPNAKDLLRFTLPLTLFEEFVTEVPVDSTANNFSEIMDSYFELLELTSMNDFGRSNVFTSADTRKVNESKDSYRFMCMDKKFQPLTNAYLGPFSPHNSDYVMEVDNRGHVCAFKRATSAAINALETYTSCQRAAIIKLLNESKGQKVRKVKVVIVDDIDLEKSGNSFLRRANFMQKTKLSNLIAAKTRFICYLQNTQDVQSVVVGEDAIYVLAKSKSDAVIFPTKLVKDIIENA